MFKLASIIDLSFSLFTCSEFVGTILFPVNVYLTTVQVRSRFLFDADADADLGYQNDADPCGSGSTTLLQVPT